jgi:transposase
MSLPAFSTQQSLFGVGSLADNLFPATNRYRLFAEKIWPLLVAARPTLETMYCADNGLPAAEPVVLAGVCRLPFLERAPDRAAMELLSMHLGWKRALHRDLDAAAFDPSLLTYFRERLLEHEQGRLVFDTILDGLGDAGLVAQRARQRLDSTHVLGVVRQISSLECVRETLRLALESLAEAVAEAQRPAAWARWWERYVESKLDFRADERTLWDKLDQAGADAWAVLEWVMSLPVAVQAQPKVTLLAQVFDESFERVEQQCKGRRRHVSGGIRNPHEPEAQWRTKGQTKHWTGYQVQVAETAAEQPVEPGEPTRQFVTAVETQPATASDEAGLAQVLAAQQAAGRERPRELYVDARM